MLTQKSTYICPDCGSKYWETWRLKGIKECTNCGHKRHYTPKVKDYSKPSKAQENKLHKIKAYFEKRTGLEIASATIRPLGSDWRKAWFDVTTEGNVLSKDGAYGTIGRRGKVEVSGCASIYGDKKQAKHFERMLND